MPLRQYMNSLRRCIGSLRYCTNSFNRCSYSLRCCFSLKMLCGHRFDGMGDRMTAFAIYLLHTVTINKYLLSFVGYKPDKGGVLLSYCYVERVDASLRRWHDETIQYARVEAALWLMAIEG